MIRIIITVVACLSVQSGMADWLSCAEIDSDKKRLACFDEAVVSASAADHTSPTETQQPLNGVLAKSLFTGKREDQQDAVTESVVIVSAKKDNRNRWVFQLENGQQWRQRDTLPVGSINNFPVNAELTLTRFNRHLLRLEGERRPNSGEAALVILFSLRNSLAHQISPQLNAMENEFQCETRFRRWYPRYSPNTFHTRVFACLA